MKKIIVLFLLTAVCSLYGEMTLSLIKPDAVKHQHIGSIIARFEENGLKVAAIKMVHLTPEKAQEFYQVHQGKPFFNELTQFMASGPIVAIVLQGPNAIAKNREIMGATDPQKAQAHTIRKDFAESVTKNAVHGSDSSVNAEAEIAYFFQPFEIVNP